MMSNDNIELYMLKETYKLLLDILTFITFLTVVLAITVFVSEIYSAKHSCTEINGTYNFKINLQHYCDDKLYIKYTDGWHIEEFKQIINNINLINYSN
jgi:hypothetical protein